MPRISTLTAPAALALCLPAHTALADLTAAEVWNDWKAYMASAGYTVTASEASSGGTLTVSDISMNIDLGEDGADGAVNIILDEVIFAEQSDGSVSIALPEESRYDIAVVPVEGEDEIEFDVLYTQSAPVMTATGSAEDITYDYSADSIALDLSEIEVGGVILTDDIARFSMAARDVAYVTRSVIGDVRSITQDIEASSLTYDAFFEDPEGEGSFTLAGAMQGLSFEGTGDLPSDTDPEDVNAMLNAGFAFDGTFSATAGNYDLTFDGPDGGGTLNSASDGGDLRVAMAPGGLRYDVAQRGVNMNVLMTAFPLPISIEAAEISTNFLMPVQKSDEEQDFGLGVTLSDFSMSDAIWGLFDPAGQLPRDPATLVLDLSGKAKVLFDFLDPAQASVLEQSDALPGELNALTLNALELDALGAKLTGAGDFTFDNGDLVTFDGMPRPNGAIDLSLVGGNGLLDKLVGMGLVPEDQAMGARMMMGLFAVPGDGEDTLNSRIEVNDQGHVLANGQRLR